MKPPKSSAFRRPPPNAIGPMHGRGYSRKSNDFADPFPPPNGALLNEMNREETIFELALGIDSPAARETYLREACAGNDPLFESLQALLKVHDRVGKFMDPAAQAQLKPSMAALLNGGPPAIQEKPGDRIGRYKLLEKIGEGGCGVVYMGEQEEPVRRRVALK